MNSSASLIRGGRFLVSSCLAALLVFGVARAQPTVVATAPTLPQSQVVSLYTSSGAYTDVPGVNFYEVWWGGQWTGYGDYAIPSTSSVVKGYQGLLFTGVGFESTPTNVAGCDTLHVALYTPNGNSFAVRMVDASGHTADVTYDTNSAVITSNTWVYLNIPMSQFVAANPLLDLYHIYQLGWIINNPGENPGADYYIDNVYFSGSTNLTFSPPPAVVNYPTNNAPTPTNSPVLAMYNGDGAYTLWPGSAGVDWNANIYEWGGIGSHNNPYLITNTGNTVMFMPALSFVGATFYSPNQVDTTGFNTLHVDVWTPNGNQLGIQLVSVSPSTQAPQVNISGIPTNQWHGIDIPLSAFTNINPNVILTDLEQMLFVDNSTVGAGIQGADFYVDNIYFYSNSAAPVGPVSVTVDPSQSWVGYMNWFALPQNGGGYAGGSVWGTADLDATFSGSVLTFTPNTSIDRDNPNDTYWWQDASGTSPGNKTMDASMYVQNDTLAGQSVVFSGYVWTNSLVNPYYTNLTAFIKDFDSGYTLTASATSNLLTSGYFSVSLTTTAGHHIQYGFEMMGPDARIATIASLGKLIVSSNAPPAGPAITVAPASASVLVGSNATLTVTATGGSLSYQWQKNGVNLSNSGNVSGANTASLTLSNCQGADEANYTVLVSNLVGSVNAVSRLTVLNPGHLTIDPTGAWVGYMNWFALPQNGGGYAGGSVWGTADLDATFSGSVLTFTPNTSIDRDNPNDTYWWQDASGTSPGNKTMDASMYLQNDNLAGHVITFSGYCLSNTLVAPYSTGTTAFIKEFASDYSSSTSVSVALVAGQSFSLNKATTAGNHVQYGFEMIGPDARIATVSGLGKLVVSTTPPTMAIAGAGNNQNLSFATDLGINYTLQYKTNLMDSAWLNYTNFTGTGGVVTIPVASSQESSFFRLAY